MSSVWGFALSNIAYSNAFLYQNLQRDSLLQGWWLSGGPVHWRARLSLSSLQPHFRSKPFNRYQSAIQENAAMISSHFDLNTSELRKTWAKKSSSSLSPPRLYSPFASSLSLHSRRLDMALNTFQASSDGTLQALWRIEVKRKVGGGNICGHF
jgi:hypothetical protein